MMEQEAAFLTALQTAATYQAGGGQLVVNYDGGALTFAADLSAVTPTPIPIWATCRWVVWQAAAGVVRRGTTGAGGSTDYRSVCTGGRERERGRNSVTTPTSVITTAL